MASLDNSPPALSLPLPASLVKARECLIRHAKELIARYEVVEEDIRVPAPVTPTPALFASLCRLTSTLHDCNFNVPEGTLTLALLHAMVFLRPNGVPLAKISLQPRNVIMKGEFYRLFTSAFTHVDVPHALFNVTALIEAGNFLEMQMGAVPFAADVALIALMSQGLYVVVSWMQHSLLDRSTQYYYDAIGFTPVNFALRTVTGIMMHAGNPVTQYLHPGLCYCFHIWIDLVFMRICFPHSNFFAHLVGIGAGLI